MQIHDLAAAETTTLTKSVSASLEKLAKAAAAEIEKQTAAAAQARADAQKAADAASAERAKAAEALEEERRQRTQLAQQLKEQSAAVSFADAARREAEAGREKEASQRAAAEAAAATAQQAIAAADKRAAAAERTLKDAEAAHAEQLKTSRARMLKSALQPLDHLRTAFDRFRGAETIDDVLRTLVEAMATEFARVAIFDVNAHRLEVSRHAGFDAVGDMAKVVVPLTLQSPLTKAVRDGRVQGMTARELPETTRALVGGSPAFVLVVPVPIRGEVKAVLYADDSGEAAAARSVRLEPDRELQSPERRVRFAEILLWHTVPLLARLAVEDEALNEFREYAASLVNDLESVYVADAARLKGGELRKRLQINLQYAKRRFAERVQNEGTGAARLLDEQIAAALERKGPTPFGRDLAAVALGADAGRQPQAAADAS